MLPVSKDRKIKLPGGILIKDVLGICPGITAVIGSGVKTSLIRRLALEICGDTTSVVSPAVIVCTTTHIMRPDDMPVYEAKSRIWGEHQTFEGQKPEAESYSSVARSRRKKQQKRLQWLAASFT